MITLLLRLYPARWRARYGEEFEQVLAERPLGPFDVADVLLGALDAHLHLRGLGAASQHAKGFAMSLRIGGYAAIAGGVLTVTSMVGGQLLGEGVLALALFGMFVATVAVLVALAGLSAFQARRYPRLAWAAFVIPALGASVTLVGLVGMATTEDVPFIGDMTAWTVWSIGLATMIGGSALFGIATWRTRALSRAAAASLVVGAILIIPAFGGMAIVDSLILPEALAPILVAAAVIGFAAGWAGLGVSALRTSRAIPAQREGASA